MRRILVVDDSELMRTLIKHALMKMGNCEVTFAKDGKDALDLILSTGIPALILLDINMPVMGGLEFLGRLTSLGFRDQVTVIIVSTEGKEDDVLRGLEAGAKGYLRKPFRANDLQDIITRVLS